MSERYSRFNVRVKDGKGLRRTTVSIETVIAELFAIWLGYDLDTVEGHTAVRLWLQERQDCVKEASADSGDLKHQMLLQIVDKALLRKLKGA